MKHDAKSLGKFSHLPSIPPWAWLLLLVINVDDVTRRGWHAGLVTVGFGLQMVVYENLRQGETMAWPWYKKLGSILMSILGLGLMIYGFWF